MKIKKVQVYRTIAIALILGACILGYYRHESIAVAAFSGAVAALAALGTLAVLHVGDALVRWLIRSKREPRR